MPKSTYSNLVASPKRTPQSQPIPGSSQVANSAGGFSWAVDKWKQLDRFLILGSLGGTYYISEQKLTRDNAASVIECLKEDGLRTINRVIEISNEGRAAKNDPAIFVFALATVYGNAETKTLVYKSLPQVCRIATHLFHFAQFVDDLRGWGSGLRKAVARWYQGQDAKQLAYQLVKYVQRDGWSHRDLLRLSHPVQNSPEHAALFRYATNGIAALGERSVKRRRGKNETTKSYGAVSEHLPEIVREFERLKNGATEQDVIKAIETFNLPHEAIPTDLKTRPAIWEAMLNKGMPLTAMIRNLANMTRIGTLAPLSPNLKIVTSTLTDEEALKKARIHPIALLNAQRTYTRGRSTKGDNTWSPISQVADALDAAFYKAFKTIEPSGANILLALDVSGSMGGGNCAGCDGLTPREGSGAMALVTAATEQNYHILGFSHTLIDLPISPKQRLDDVIRKISNIPFGATDCAQPMLWALKHKAHVDLFCIYTDSETWVGTIQPTQALAQYRREINPNARYAVIAMVGNQFTIADPNDAGMLDVVGFDTNTPAVLSDFAAGRV